MGGANSGRRERDTPEQSMLQGELYVLGRVVDEDLELVEAATARLRRDQSERDRVRRAMARAMQTPRQQASA